MYKNLVEFIITLRDWVAADAPLPPPGASSFVLYSYQNWNPFQVNVNLSYLQEAPLDIISIQVSGFSA